MKKSYVILIHLLLFACNPENKANSEAVVDGSGKGKTVIRTQTQQRQDQLFSLYYPVQKFPLQVSTVPGTNNPEAPGFEYKGKEIPADLLLYFKETPWYFPKSRYKFFATKRFDLGNNKFALLTRVPGEYWESMVVLFIFDAAANKIIDGLPVAETFGDAGDSYILNASLTRTPDDFRIHIKQDECHPKDYELDEIECTDSLKIYSLRAGRIKLVEKKFISSRME